jgi:hypothetical protein
VCPIYRCCIIFETKDIAIKSEETWKSKILFLLHLVREHSEEELFEFGFSKSYLETELQKPFYQ